MLHQFLVAHREEILSLAKEKTLAVSGDRPTSSAVERGLPKFYDHLAHELERRHGPDSTARYGKELERLGYTVSQVVHLYGCLSQAITEYAAATHAPISSGEFKTLYLNLDIAIAEAVTGFTQRAIIENIDSTKRIGFLVHELRNSLAAALIAHSMVKKGIVDADGSTNALLERNLNRMRDLLDRSFAAVRMQHDKVVAPQRALLLDIAGEVEATASEEARSRGLTIKVEVAPQLQITVDRNYLVSALSNLVQNAIKYSRPGGTIRIRSRETEKHAMLDVEDQCGGLPKGKAEELFKPFTQKGFVRTGLGLGLAISRQAVEMNGGTLTVRDLPGKGCVFTITLLKRQTSHPHHRRLTAAP